MFKHGGRILQAAQRYGIPESDWLDLSTGINPDSYPFTPIPEQYWHDLPQDDDGLHELAQQYYQCVSLLAVAGSQAAIQALPRLRLDKQGAACVAVLSPSYFEHAKAWQAVEHDVMLVNANNIDSVIDSVDVCVLVNPNNPTGERFSVEQCLDWQQRLAARGGWLVVDEAFMDVTPEQSLARYSDREGFIVLRSMGKFFGLAGIRLGFVLASASILTPLANYLGPWAVNSPARFIARQALADQAWQAQTRVRLLKASLRLQKLLRDNDLKPAAGTALFQWLEHPYAEDIHDALAALGILTRYFPPEHTGQASLRFGLPAGDDQWQRLAMALSLVCVEA